MTPTEEAGSGPEMEVLLCCAGVSLDPERAERGGRLLRQGLDWNRLIALAQTHGVAALLYRNLHTTYPDLVPPEVLEQLRAGFHALAWRNLLLSKELIGLVKLLQASAIPAVPFKGLVLGVLAYGDLALRPFGDFDILVPEPDALKAKDLLTAQGYQLKPSLTDAEATTLLRAEREHHFTLHRKGLPVAVELHWRVLQKCYAFPLEDAGLWDRLAPVRLGDATVASFGVEDLLLLLSAHGAKHLWSRLRLVVDLDGLIRSHPTLNWGQIMSRADRLHGRRLLGIGLMLTHTLFGTPVPQEVMERLQADPHVAALTDEVAAQLQGELRDTAAIEAQDAGAFFVRARERLRDRVRVCLGLEWIPAGVDSKTLPRAARLFFHLARAVAPKERDRAVLKLPRPLAWLYYFVRPARLLGKYTGEMGRRLAGLFWRRG